ncbi:hypothetical protein GCM10025859_18400 [Alicyclobacillus fastidiosus]|nr:hypothetical protein GCM10025859_18400 [Alicyclobacillus fastidiosus]
MTTAIKKGIAAHAGMDFAIAITGLLANADGFTKVPRRIPTPIITKFAMPPPAKVTPTIFRVGV